MILSNVLMNSSKKWKPYAKSFSRISMMKKVNMKKLRYLNEVSRVLLPEIYSSMASSTKMTTHRTIVIPRIEFSTALISTKFCTFVRQTFISDISEPPSWIY